MNKYFDNLMMICVIMNTVILALDGLVDSSGEATLN